jgi:flagellar assembly protein FliH
MKKFLFDTDNFDKSKTGPVATYTEEQLALARTQAYNQGRGDGVKEALKWQEEIISVSLQEIGMLMEKLSLNEERRELEKSVSAVKLAMRVAHKLLPEFARKFALQEVERVIVDSIEVRRDEPRIAITVAAAHLDALKTRIDAWALEKGFAGKLILLGDDHLKESDVRVEWADGGAERLYERLFSQIETECAKAIEGLNALVAETDNKGEIR